MTPSPTTGSPALAICWSRRFQARTSALGPALGGESCHVYGDWPGRQLAFVPVRYATDAVRMWRVLRRHRPRVLVAVSPPVMSPIVGWFWCLIHRCRLVVDCHSGLFYARKWRWTVPIHVLLFRRAQAVLVHTEEDRLFLHRWHVPAIVLPDDLPDPSQAARPRRLATTAHVVVAGSLGEDEPVAQALAAAALLPEVEVRVTGDVGNLPASVRAGPPPNAVFTGLLPYGQFLGELLAADAVAVFTTEARAMNRAAFEAIGLGCPLVLSDVPALRTRFERAAIFCANEPAAMAQAIRQGLRDRRVLADRSRALQRSLHEQREAALEQLRSMLALPHQPRPRTAARAGSHP